MAKEADLQNNVIYMFVQLQLTASGYSSKISMNTGTAYWDLSN